MYMFGVLGNLRTFFRLLRDADTYLAKHQVDAVVLVDYPGFNWWIARKAKKHGVPVFYYGVPQMWAWAPWRVKKLRKLVDWSLCKLPFEVDWFEQRGCQAHYVGHPYFDQLERHSLDHDFIKDFEDPGSKLLVLLPGSRDQEVNRHIDWLLESAELVQRRHKKLAVAVACFNEKHAEQVRSKCQEREMPFDVMVNRTSELISMSDACIACSGSVSLELMHRKKPTVIVYRLGPVFWGLQWLLLKSRFITLVNLFATKQISRNNRKAYEPDGSESASVPMPEYLSVSNCAPQMARWINRWFKDSETYQSKVDELARLAEQFGQTGASERAAEFILAKIEPEQTVEPAQPTLRAAA